MRLALVLGTIAFAVICYALMLTGWRGRQRRQGDLPAPAPRPADPGPVLLGATRGLFVGTVLVVTTVDQSWLDRVAVHRLSDRSTGWLTVYGSGVGIEREGPAELYLPYDVLVDARPGDALAGKVVGRDGLLLLTWRLGARQVVSAFRADDHAAHQRIAAAIGAQLPVRNAS